MQVNTEHAMSAAPEQEIEDDDGLEAAVAEAVAANNGNLREALRALVTENRVLKKSVSLAFMRRRFRTYSG